MDPERLASLRNSNEVPLDAERATLLASIQRIQTRTLPLLNEEIRRLRAVLDDMENKSRKRLLDELTEMKAITSPIRYLPADILQEIFIYCLSTTKNASISYREPPFLLTFICSRWRNIAVSTPLLWSSIDISFVTTKSFNNEGIFTVNEPGRDISSINRTKMAIQQWLPRARNLPLSISFTEGSWPLADPSFMADAIEPFLHRCKSIALVINTQGFLPTASSNLPIIESLSVSAGSRYGDPPHGLCAAPRLRALSVGGPCINTAAIPHRWPMLTSLSIAGAKSVIHDSFTFKDLVPLLRAMPGLVIGSFGFSHVPHLTDSDSEYSKTLDAIHLPMLKKLSTFCDQPYVLLNLIRCLDLPILQAVQIVDASTDVWNARLASKEFPLLAAISQTRETLRHLTINTQIYARGEVYLCLEECQLLTSLSILGWTIDDEFLQRFIPRQGSPTPVFCPNLEHLEWEGTTYITDSCLLQFIIQRQSQIPGIAKLKSISARLYRLPQEDIRPHLAKYIADGLRVTLKYTQDEE